MKKLLLFITLLLSFTANSQIKLWQLPYLSSPATSDTLIIRRGINYKTAVSNVLSLAGGGGGGLDTTAGDTRYIKNLAPTATAQSANFKISSTGVSSITTSDVSNGALWLVSPSFTPTLLLKDGANTTFIYSYAPNGAGGTAISTGDYGTWSTAPIAMGVLNLAGFRQTGTEFQESGSMTVGGIFAPDASAKLQVISTTKGFLPPKMTTSQKNAISSPAEGLMVYDTDIHKLYVYDGTTWQAAW